MHYDRASCLPEEKATLSDGKITTHIGILHEKRHSEPWIIAMDCKPSKYRVLDYGMRRGIECLFSDFKSRGLGITKTQLRHPYRIERLILILTLALYWAISTVMTPREVKNQTKKTIEITYLSLQERTKNYTKCRIKPQRDSKAMGIQELCRVVRRAHTKTFTLHINSDIYQSVRFLRNLI